MVVRQSIEKFFDVLSELTANALGWHRKSFWNGNCQQSGQVYILLSSQHQHQQCLPCIKSSVQIVHDIYFGSPALYFSEHNVYI